MTKLHLDLLDKVLSCAREINCGKNEGKPRQKVWYSTTLRGSELDDLVSFVEHLKSLDHETPSRP